MLGRARKNELFYLKLIPLLVFQSVCSSSLATTTLVSRNKFTCSRAYQKKRTACPGLSSLGGNVRQRLLPALCRAFRVKEWAAQRIPTCLKTTEMLDLLQDTVGWGPSDVHTHSFQFLGVTVRASQECPFFPLLLLKIQVCVIILDTRM